MFLIKVASNCVVKVTTRFIRFGTNTAQGHVGGQKYMMNKTT